MPRWMFQVRTFSVVPLVDVDPEDVEVVPDVDVEPLEVDDPPQTTVSFGRTDASLLSDR